MPCCLFYRVCNMFLKELTSFLAALLFAVHPIHTEAVSFYIFNRFIESVWNIFNFFVKSLEKKNDIVNFSSIMFTVVKIPVIWFFKYFKFLHQCLSPCNSNVKKTVKKCLHTSIDIQIYHVNVCTVDVFVRIF